MRLFIPVSVFRFHALQVRRRTLFPCFSLVSCTVEASQYTHFSKKMENQKEKGARLIYLNYN